MSGLGLVCGPDRALSTRTEPCIASTGPCLSELSPRALCQLNVALNTRIRAQDPHILSTQPYVPGSQLHATSTCPAGPTPPPPGPTCQDQAPVPCTAPAQSHTLRSSSEALYHLCPVPHTDQAPGCPVYPIYTDS